MDHRGDVVRCFRSVVRQLLQRPLSGPHAPSPGGDTRRGLARARRAHRARIDDGSFAREFPVYGCESFPAAITGTDHHAFETELGTLIPEFRKAPDLLPDNSMSLLNARLAPATPVALDVIDFAGRYIAEPVKRYQHSQVQHEHLEFDPLNSRVRGQRKFRDDVELADR